MTSLMKRTKKAERHAQKAWMIENYQPFFDDSDLHEAPKSVMKEINKLRKLTYGLIRLKDVESGHKQFTPYLAQNLVILAAVYDQIMHLNWKDSDVGQLAVRCLGCIAEHIDNEIDHSSKWAFREIVFEETFLIAHAKMVLLSRRLTKIRKRVILYLELRKRFEKANQYAYLATLNADRRFRIEKVTFDAEHIMIESERLGKALRNKYGPWERPKVILTDDDLVPRNQQDQTASANAQMEGSSSTPGRPEFKSFEVTPAIDSNMAIRECSISVLDSSGLVKPNAPIRAHTDGSMTIHYPSFSTTLDSK